MDLVTRYDVLMLELKLFSPSLFSYAEKQLLASRDPGAIERLVDRKLRKLRAKKIGLYVLAALVLSPGVVTAVVSKRWDLLPSGLFWFVALFAFAREAERQRG